MINPYDPQAMSDAQRRQYTDYSRGKMQDWMTSNGQPYMVSGGGSGAPSRENLGISSESDWMRQNNITAANPGYREAELAQDAQRKAMIAQNAQQEQAQRTANGWGPQTSGANLGMGGSPTMQTMAQPTAQPAQQPTMQHQGIIGQRGGDSGMIHDRNPYLQQVGQALTAQSNQNLRQNVLPGIGQGAQAAGMYGSSRQGTAEGIAMGNAQTGLNSALANMYSQGYGQDQQYDLGLRNNNLGFANLDSNNAQFGANFGLQSQNYQNQWANNNVNAANQMAQTPWNQFNQSAGLANGIAGQGGSTSQTNQGNPWLGGLGGMQLGQQLFGKP